MHPDFLRRGHGNFVLGTLSYLALYAYLILAKPDLCTFLQQQFRNCEYSAFVSSLTCSAKLLNLRRQLEPQIYSQLVISTGGLESLSSMAGFWDGKGLCLIVKDCALACKDWLNSGSFITQLHHRINSIRGLGSPSFCKENYTLSSSLQNESLVLSSVSPRVQSPLFYYVEWKPTVFHQEK